MKKYLLLFYSLVIASNSFAFAPKIVNEKLLSVFKECFPRAEKVVWTEQEGFYIVSFVDDSIRMKIIYEKDGTFVKSTRYYLERNLPYYLLVNIKQRYPEKQIFGVTEISTISGISYYIKLVDANVWITIKVDSDGTITRIEKFKRQKG